MRGQVPVLEVLQADYHRNGTGGEGFYVGIVRCDVDGTERNMLITFFPEYREDGKPALAGKFGNGDYHNGRVAVLDTDVLLTDGVRWGANSWRGDNFYDAADAIVEATRGVQNLR